MDQVTAEMDQISIKSPAAQPTSPPSSPPPPCPYLPPEILSHILDNITHHSHQEENATYARLCLVGRSFLPIAQECLYSTSFVCIYAHLHDYKEGSESAELEDFFRRELLLFETLTKAKHLARLVRTIYISFAERPPSSKNALQATELISQLKNVRQIWFEEGEKGKEWWPLQENTEAPDHLRALHAALSQRRLLEVLSIPQFRFPPVEALRLLDSLEHLTTFRGQLFTPSPSATSTLDRRWLNVSVTRHETPQDLYFFLAASFSTLRFLHLRYSGDKLILLDTFIHLTDLVVTIVGNFPSLLSAADSSDNFHTFLTSCKLLPSLSSFSLLFEDVNVLNRRVFCADVFGGGLLPRGLQELAVGPKSSLSLNWQNFLDDMKSSSPLLNKLYLSGAGNLEPWESGTQVMFGVRDMEKAYGVQVVWMKEEDWEEWIDGEFYPEDD
ncbi:hypothetical protein JCM5353_005049 [Sporobolomyces roseus]